MFKNLFHHRNRKTRFVFHLNQSIFGLILKTQQRIKLHAVVPDINRRTTYNIIYEFPFSFARNFLIDQKIMMKAEKREKEIKGGKENTSNCCFFYEVGCFFQFFISITNFHRELFFRVALNTNVRKSRFHISVRQKYNFHPVLTIKSTSRRNRYSCAY